MRGLFSFKRRNASEVWSWAAYDFANSAFATTIIAVIYNAYYAGVVAGGAGGVVILGTSIPGATLFSWFVSAAMIVTAIASPVLGAISDLGGLKKQLLAVHVALGTIATAALYTVGEGEWLWGGILFLFGQFAFAGGNVFYNAMLYDIAEPEDYGKISGLGWAFGYLGGGLLLAVNLVMLQYPELIGFSEGAFTVQDCFLSVAIWWAVFTIPILSRVPGGSRKSLTKAKIKLTHALGDLRIVLRRLKELPQFARFFFAYLFYNDGIETVIVMASIFGSQELGMGNADLIMFFLMIQAIALAGSLLFGFLADKFGSKRAVLSSLIIWLGVVVWAWQLGVFGDSLREYWMLGMLAGVVMGGSQAASRSLQAELIPPNRSAEFFSFFGISGRFASAIGPAILGLAVLITGSLRAGVASLIIFFAAGIILLLFVDEQEGRQQALSFDRKLETT